MATKYEQLSLDIFKCDICNSDILEFPEDVDLRICDSCKRSPSAFKLLKAEKDILNSAIYHGASLFVKRSKKILAILNLLEDSLESGDLSDGYHTFNQLYNQRLILSAALCNAYPEKCWKSCKHEDGNLCFDGNWFIIGFDTADGSYTYHYPLKFWDLFSYQELPVAKHWDGHTADDVERLLKL